MDYLKICLAPTFSRTRYPIKELNVDFQKKIKKTPREFSFIKYYSIITKETDILLYINHKTGHFVKYSLNSFPKYKSLKSFRIQRGYFLNGDVEISGILPFTPKIWNNGLCSNHIILKIMFIISKARLYSSNE